MPRRKNTLRKIGKHVVTLSESGATRLAGRRKPTRSKTEPPAIRGPPLPDATYIDAPQLLARFGGRSHMWLVRLLARDQSFPRPVRIGRLRFFMIDEVVDWERKVAAERAA